MSNLREEIEAVELPEGFEEVIKLVSKMDKRDWRYLSSVINRAFENKVAKTKIAIDDQDCDWIITSLKSSYLMIKP